MKMGFHFHHSQNLHTTDLSQLLLIFSIYKINNPTQDIAAELL